MEIKNFEDFCAALDECGFSMGGGSAKGIYAVIPYNWENQEFVDSPVKWHTGDPQTDPWEWRMRVLEECDDIAYSKVFFRTSGYITKPWYPLFYSVRRGGVSFDEAYDEGQMSRAEKTVYTIVSELGDAALHDIRAMGGFKTGAEFEQALTRLQTRMFITMSGRAQKLNKNGEGYGWNSTVFCTVERFWERRGLTLTASDPVQAFEKIKRQVLLLNPSAEEKKIKSFING